MEKAIAREMVASKFEEVKAVADTFAEISKAHPGKWESLYWAAFDYSQVWVFGQSSENGKYLDIAQAYYQKALAALPERSPRQEAEFQTLRALLNGLKAYYHTQENHEDIANLFRALSKQALAAAEQADASNPRVAMMKSISLFNNPETRREGIKAMKAAIKAYDRFERDSPISPDWGKSFLEFRLNRVEQARNAD